MEMEFEEEEVNAGEFRAAMEGAEAKRVISKAQEEARPSMQQKEARQSQHTPKTRKKRLDEQIAALDKHFDNRIDKWTNPSDFSKVDLVCGELIKKGQVGEAVKYMERVRRLVDTLVTKLKAKEKGGGGGGPIPEEKHAAGEGTPRTKDPAPVAARQPRKSMVVMSTEQGEREMAVRRELATLQQKHKAALKALDEAEERCANKVATVQLELDAWQAEARNVRRQADSQVDQLMRRALVLQSAETKASQATTQVAILEDKCAGFVHLLQQADAKAEAEASKVAQMKRRLVEAQSVQREAGNKEARLALALATRQHELEEKEDELAATTKAAKVALKRQEEAMQGLQSRIEAQALELQRRDEILHAMQSRLQSSGQNIVDFLTPLPETAEVTKAHDSSSRPMTVGSDGTLTAPPTPTLQQSEKLHDATVRAQRHFKGAPYAVADWGARTGFGREQPGMHDRSRPVSRDLRIPTPGGTAVRSSTAGSSRRLRTPMDSGAGARQAYTSGGSSHRSRASSVASEAASEGGGVPIWITFNEGKGNHMKPWIIHQRVRCEPAGHVVLLGISQLQSVEGKQAQADAMAAHGQLCSCGVLGGHGRGYFELAGNVVWRGRTAVLGPPAHGSGPRHRSVLGLEAPGESDLTAFNPPGTLSGV